MSNKQTGSKGEQLAASYLIEKGFVLLDTNWRFHHLELDIVALKDDFLVVIEVKSRTSLDSGEPHEWVSRKKQLHLIHATNAYLLYHQLQYEIRFDIVAILLTSEGPVFSHFEDAFSAIG